MVRPTKKLHLKKEVLAELTNAELARVAGGAITLNTCIGAVCPTATWVESCGTPCDLPSNPLYSCPTLNGICFEAAV